MENYKRQLIEQREEIKKLQDFLNAKISNNKTKPKKIAYSKRKNGYQYYIYHSESDREYVKKKDINIVQAAVQQEYYEHLLQALVKQEKLIGKFLKDYDIESLKSVHTEFAEAKRMLIVPLIATDEQYIEQWKLEHPDNRNPFKETGKYVTERGECVRSKSEMILANMFNKYNIPYRYEPELKLKNGRRVYPDFLLLNVHKRKDIYWEHLGLIDDGEYASKNLNKLNEYEKAGLYLGDNLLISMESDLSPLNINVIKNKIEKYFIPQQ